MCTNECVLLTCVAYANVIDQGMCLSLVLCGYGCLRVCSLIRLLRAYVLCLCVVVMCCGYVLWLCVVMCCYVCWVVKCGVLCVVMCYVVCVTCCVLYCGMRCLVCCDLTRFNSPVMKWRGCGD